MVTICGGPSSNTNEGKIVRLMLHFSSSGKIFNDHTSAAPFEASELRFVRLKVNLFT